MIEQRPSERDLQAATLEMVAAGVEFRLSVGAQFRAARRRLGWSVDDVIERLPNETCRSTIYRYETGGRDIPMQALWEICVVLGLDVVVVIRAASQTAVPSAGLGWWSLDCKQGQSNAVEVQRGLVRAPSAVTALVDATERQHVASTRFPPERGRS